MFYYNNAKFLFFSYSNYAFITLPALNNLLFIAYNSVLSAQAYLLTPN